MNNKYNIVPDKIIKSKRKTISIEINKDGELIVRSPWLVSKKKIEEFIILKEEWIFARQQRVLEQQSNIADIQYEIGKNIWYFGERIKIETTDKKKIYLDEQILYIPEKYHDDLKKHTVKWYKKMAKESLIPKTIELANRYNCKVKDVKISSGDKTWGSCSISGNINLSYKLIFVPAIISEYVIIHELAHTFEHNHSSRFWSKLGEMMPEYKKYDKWLRDNQYLYKK